MFQGTSPKKSYSSTRNILVTCQGRVSVLGWVRKILEFKFVPLWFVWWRVYLSFDDKLEEYAEVVTLNINEFEEAMLPATKFVSYDSWELNIHTVSDDLVEVDDPENDTATYILAGVDSAI